jgi:hypothetical protein
MNTVGSVGLSNLDQVTLEAVRGKLYTIKVRLLGITLETENLLKEVEQALTQAGSTPAGSLSPTK